MPTIDEDSFEALLEQGDLDTAARLLFSPSTTLLIEAGVEAEPMRAVVRCATLGRAVEGRGDTAAGAALIAWANWLVTLRLEFGTDLAGPPRQNEELATCEDACLRVN